MMQGTLQELIDYEGWMGIPKEVITAEGRKMDASSDDWYVLLPDGKTGLLFSKIPNPYVRWAAKRFALSLLTTTSSHAGFRFWRDFHGQVNNVEECQIASDIQGEELRERLVDVVQTVLARNRRSHTLSHAYYVVRWYLWCVDNIPQCGFDSVYGEELAGMTIPGGPKGDAVRDEDPDLGPLNRTVELPLLLDALNNDTSSDYKHLQEKAALALCLAFGRNPLNMSWLNEDDLYNLTDGLIEVDPCYMLRIPRIKKRQGSPRHDFLEEKLDYRYAKHVIALIEANRHFASLVSTEEGVVKVRRPMFRIRRPRKNKEVPKEYAEWVLRMGPDQFGALIGDFVSRHGIESPVTGKRLHVTPRRLRYTLATALVEEGVSRRELARILDHSDTQHVEVYFELGSKVVRYLDAAMAKGMSRYFDHFQGALIDRDSEAINGDRADKHLSFVGESDPNDETEIGVCGHAALCDLDPPFSCYLCPLFQPYRHADHEHVLELLIQSRESRMDKYENSRIGVQMDDVIFAVGRVVEACEDPKNG